MALANLSPAVQSSVSWRKPVVATAFSIVCILGTLAGILPSKCSSMFHFSRRKQRELTGKAADSPKEVLVSRGHHPDCGSFAAHVFRLGNRVFCAGCVGLIMGAVLSLFGLVFYLFANMASGTTQAVFWVGILGVSSGLLQYHLFNWDKSSVHLSVNSLFVFSVFLLLATVDTITQNVVIDFYLIGLSIFWVYTRILLSQLDHKRICRACHIEGCEFHARKSVERR